MGENTRIEWADHTWNPWVGCTKVGPGCEHCYAERVGARMHVSWGVGAPRKRTSWTNWQQPLIWNRRAEREGRRYRVFCASLADVFDNEVREDWRNDLWEIVLSTKHLDWLLLTKRIGNARRMMPWADPAQFPVPSNVWLGATVVNQDEANRDIPKLLSTPAAVRFLSIEPILGPIDLALALPLMVCGRGAGNERGGVDWIIVGGESGPNARWADVEHIGSIVKQCQAAGVPVFVKQLGSHVIGWCAAQRHPKGGEPCEWPAHLRVREML